MTRKATEMKMTDWLTTHPQRSKLTAESRQNEAELLEEYVVMLVLRGGRSGTAHEIIDISDQ